ncbi:fibronectin type III domain-containing protein [Paenibacillus antarcticus]|uniref:Uncharacterized protein n=1 Tax=Paenibacillus antarcticus TaxID=253703 RepID=A0A168Q752_9BACL|nr:fibronectin type III domain-containing protein [Paenibacillus antarcticus]OAB47457.1 hypothetical protein PBAT_07140 [Paenibacillus antarcticus]
MKFRSSVLKKFAVIGMAVLLMLTSIPITTIEAAAPGLALGSFKSPHGITVDAGGNIYVSDRLNNRVQKLMVSTGTWQEWTFIKGTAEPGSAPGRFWNPQGIAIGPSGALYLADSSNNYIQKFQGGSWSAFNAFGNNSDTAPTSAVGRFKGPNDVAVSNDGIVYVLDYNNNRIQYIGENQSTWTIIGNNGNSGSSGTAVGQLSMATGIATDSNGNVYVADNGNKRIQKYDPNAATKWSVFKEDFKASAIAIDSADNIYISNGVYNESYIQKYSADTQTWTQIGSQGTELGQFSSIAGLATDTTGNLYVTDSSNNRIQKLTVNTGTWKEWPIVLTVPAAPTGVTATASNREASVSFTAPSNNGGANITQYKVTASPGGITQTGTTSPITVAGLTNGTAYTFTVTATNSQGTSVASTPSSNVTPATAPDAPTEVTATAGNKQATVNFKAPSNTGGSAITEYTVNAISEGNLLVTKTGTASPITVTGLTNGTAYTFTVTAKNSVATSVASEPSPSVKPVSVPSAPTGVTATANNGEASVSFTAPADTGGLAITEYKVTASSSGNPPVTQTGTTSPITVTGLTNGTAYTFTVKATNSVGTSVASTPSSSVTPATAPDAPKDVTAIAGSKQVTVSFTAPDNNGGSPITEYTVTASSTGNPSVTKTGTVSPITVIDLTNGTAYTFTVTAKNSVSTSAPSAASTSVTPVSVPGVPTNVTATAGNASATVTFTAPADNGGLAITGYKVTASSSDNALVTQTGSGSPIIVTGLTNGTAYTFTVTATNSQGTSESSESSSSTTPATAPDAPTNVLGIAGDKSIGVFFTMPSNTGGSPITEYTVTASSSGNPPITQTGTTSPITVTGLTNGTAYTITLTAKNSVSTSVPSAASTGVTPVSVPGVPTNVTATAGNKEAKVTFTAPSDNGGLAVTEYTVTSSPGGITATGPTSPITVTGLTNGTAYTFIVTATNSRGTSAQSVSSSSVTPATAPDAPTDVTASAGSGKATVSFKGPSNIGGNPITEYKVTSNPGGIIATGTASPITVTGLTNGTAYTFTVTAKNSVSASAPSTASTSVTPVSVPDAPTNVLATAGNGDVSVSFTAPVDNGGSSIINYELTVSPGGNTFTGTSSPIIVTGLTNGIYTFTVTAINSVGKSMPSSSSDSVTLVNPEVQSVNVLPAAVEVKQDQTQQLNATVIAVGGADKTVKWLVGDDYFGTDVTVNESTGLVSIASNAELGNYTIIAESIFDSNKYGTATITVTDQTVEPEVLNVNINPATANVEQGQIQQLNAIVSVQGEASKEVMWTSSDDSKVMVDHTGLVTVVSNAQLGDYTITATSTANSARSGLATITVTEAPTHPSVTNVSVDPSTASVVQGSSKQLTATVTVLDGASQEVLWTSSDSNNKVSVNASGYVTVASDTPIGNYIIAATSKFDSTKKASATITVTTATPDPGPGPGNGGTGGSGGTGGGSGGSNPISGSVTTPTPKPTPEPEKPQGDVFSGNVVDATKLVNMIASKIAEANQSGVKNELTDVKGHWAASTIDLFVKLGVIKGYSDGSVNPNGQLTRAEFASIISRLFDIGSSTTGQTVALNDISNHWGKDAIKDLASLGVISGYGNGEFKPNQTISREEIVMILSRIIKLDSLNKDASKGKFSDISSASSYAMNAIQNAAQSGIINGKNDGNFDPQGKATRAETLTILLNVLELQPEVKKLLESLI